MSTGILMIVPDAFDLTSTMSIGSTVPLACALRTMLRRWTGAVSITTAVVAVFLHAPPATTIASAIAMRRAPLDLPFFVISLPGVSGSLTADPAR